MTDPRALVTYSLCVGASFGTVEDLFLYAFAYGIDNTVARALLSVPLHCMTAMLMGCAVAEDRFGNSQPWYKAVLLPILLHGTFDAANFILSDKYVIPSLIVAVLIIVVGTAYVRWWLLSLMSRMPIEEDIHKSIEQDTTGSIIPPSTKSMAMVIVIGCVFCTCMLCFLYLW